MTPKKGPIGTMITLTYSGLGSSLYEGGASLPVRQPLRRRVDGQLDARRRDGQVPRLGARRPAHGRGHRRDQLRLPQHPAVADPVGERAPLHVQRHEGRGPAEAADGLAGLRRPDARREDDAGRRRPLGRQRRGEARARASGPVLSKVDVSALRPHAERSRQPRLVDGRRQPRQLHGHVLELRLGAARQRNGSSRTAR